MATFATIPLDERIGALAADLRRTHRLKLPDAIVWATAKVFDCLLITRDTGDFPAEAPDIRVPYRLP